MKHRQTLFAFTFLFLLVPFSMAQAGSPKLWKGSAGQYHDWSSPDSRSLELRYESVPTAGLYGNVVVSGVSTVEVEVPDGVVSVTTANEEGEVRVHFAWLQYPLDSVRTVEAKIKAGSVSFPVKIVANPSALHANKLARRAFSRADDAHRLASRAQTTADGATILAKKHKTLGSHGFAMELGPNFAVGNVGELDTGAGFYLRFSGRLAKWGTVSLHLSGNLIHSSYEVEYQVADALANREGKFNEWWLSLNIGLQWDPSKWFSVRAKFGGAYVLTQSWDNVTDFESVLDETGTRQWYLLNQQGVKDHHFGLRLGVDATVWASKLVGFSFEYNLGLIFNQLVVLGTPEERGTGVSHNIMAAFKVRL